MDTVANETDLGINSISGNMALKMESDSDFHVSQIKHSLTNLILFAERTLAPSECDELFSTSIEMLEQAVSGLREASNAVDELSNFVRNATSISSESALLASLASIPNDGNLELNVASYSTLSSSAVAKCIQVHRSLKQRGDRLVLKHINDSLKASLEEMRLDRFFGI